MEKHGSSISVKESQMPNEAGIDTVLRLKNNKFIMDKIATEELQNEITEMINKLLAEQEQKIQSQRIENHIYEFIEKSENTVWLLDQNDNSKGCFQETDFPTELANKANKGDKFQYLNGEYRVVI